MRTCPRNDAMGGEAQTRVTWVTVTAHGRADWTQPDPGEGVRRRQLVSRRRVGVCGADVRQRREVGRAYSNGHTAGNSGFTSTCATGQVHPGVGETLVNPKCGASRGHVGSHPSVCAVWSSTRESRHAAGQGSSPRGRHLVDLRGVRACLPGGRADEAPSGQPHARRACRSQERSPLRAVSSMRRACSPSRDTSTVRCGHGGGRARIERGLRAGLWGHLWLIPLGSSPWVAREGCSSERGEERRRTVGRSGRDGADGASATGGSPQGGCERP